MQRHESWTALYHLSAPRSPFDSRHPVSSSDPVCAWSCLWRCCFSIVVAAEAIHIASGTEFRRQFLTAFGWMRPTMMHQPSSSNQKNAISDSWTSPLQCQWASCNSACFGLIWRMRTIEELGKGEVFKGSESFSEIFSYKKRKQNENPEGELLELWPLACDPWHPSLRVAGIPCARWMWPSTVEWSAQLSCKGWWAMASHGLAMMICLLVGHKIFVFVIFILYCSYHIIDVYLLEYIVLFMLYLYIYIYIVVVFLFFSKALLEYIIGLLRIICMFFLSFWLRQLQGLQVGLPKWLQIICALELSLASHMWDTTRLPIPSRTWRKSGKVCGGKSPSLNFCRVLGCQAAAVQQRMHMWILQTSSTRDSLVCIPTSNASQMPWEHGLGFGSGLSRGTSLLQQNSAISACWNQSILLPDRSM